MIYDMILYNMIRYNMIYDVTRYGTIRYDMIYHTILYDTIWYAYDIARYDMFDMISADISQSLKPTLYNHTFRYLQGQMLIFPMTLEFLACSVERWSRPSEWHWMGD